MVAAQDAAKYRKPLLSGTTGFNKAELETIEKYAKETVILLSSNTSFGVNLVKKEVRNIALMLDSSYDAEIIEEHHNKKKDAPSGTALLLGEAVAQGRKISLKDNSVIGRCGVAGERKNGEIGFSSVRCGKTVGTHTVIFDNGFERIEVKHTAYSRDIFSYGAIGLALALLEKKLAPGKIYSFEDIF
jgi:4-hydroxy-tetrahydrodipicolinate reductase